MPETLSVATSRLFVLVNENVRCRPALHELLPPFLRYLVQLAV
jgi:hypothetical protein